MVTTNKGDQILKYKLRTAAIADIERIRLIFNHAILHTTAVYSYEPYSLRDMTDWYHQKIDNEFPIIVASVNNTVIGFASYGTFRQRPAYRHTMEHSVYVHPDYQKKGIGKSLLNELISLAKLNNVHTLIGGVDAENIGSIDFHKNMGFNEVAHIKEVGYKFNRWLDLKLFQLILT